MNKHSNNKSVLCHISMLVLALFPILDYYIFYNQFKHSYVMGFLVLITALLNGNFHGFKIPRSYLLYWSFITFQLYFIAGIEGWSDFFPGGIIFVNFSLCMFGFAVTFNLDLLYKYMKWIFIIASFLFIIQYSLFYITHIRVSFFMPFSDQLSYVGMTYSELVKIHQTIGFDFNNRFSSIFAEPSHFGQYSLLLLVLELHKGNNVNKLFTPFSLFIIAIIFFNESGAGLLGVLIVAMIKLLYIVFVTRKVKYYIMLVAIIPIFFILANLYKNTSAGTHAFNRVTEIGEYNDRDVTTSTFERIYNGWYGFGDLKPKQKLLGTSRNSLLDQRGFFNGVTTVLYLEGIVGFFLLAFFYYDCCRKSETYCIAISLLFLSLSLIGSTYLSGGMMIVTALLLGTKITATRSKIVLEKWQALQK